MVLDAIDPAGMDWRIVKSVMLRSCISSWYLLGITWNDRTFYRTLLVWLYKTLFQCHNPSPLPQQNNRSCNKTEVFLFLQWVEINCFLHVLADLYVHHRVRLLGECLGSTISRSHHWCCFMIGQILKKLRVGFVFSKTS